MRITLFTISFVMLLLMMLLLPGCKTMEEGFDIRGTWNITQFPMTSWTITFNGTVEEGAVTDTYIGGQGQGIYRVHGSVVSFELDYHMGKFQFIYQGTISSDYHMFGQWIARENGVENSGNWSATR